MKKHIMRLNPIPMENIRNGNKTIELRLYDEKRRKIAVGDTIKFVNSKNITDTLCVTVVDLFVFDSFDELYKTLPLSECGYTKDNIDQASPQDMDCYYSEEEQDASPRRRFLWQGSHEGGSLRRIYGAKDRLRYCPRRSV